MAMNATLQTQI